MGERTGVLFSIYLLVQKSTSLFAMFCMGFSLLFYQILSLRMVEETQHFHSAFIIVGIGLLGIGASGTFLSVFHSRVTARIDLWISGGIALFSCIASLSLPLITALPLDIFYFVYNPIQILYLLLQFIIFFLVFFSGGLVVVSILERFSQNSPQYYGIQLIAGGLGGLLPLFLFTYFPSRYLVHLGPLVALVGGFGWTIAASPKEKELVRRIWISSALVVAVLLFLPWEPKPAPYKSSYFFQTLSQTGKAQLVYEKNSLWGSYTVYKSTSFHYVPFASLAATSLPPPQLTILKDGEYAGTIFKSSKEEDANILDATPQSLPYHLLDKPKVLILDEAGGLNSLIALRGNASSVTIVVRNPVVRQILEKHLDPRVELIQEDPRLFVERAKMEDRRFDLIHLASIEGFPAATSGLLATRENYLLTVEGMRETLSLLTEDGLLSISRGIEHPPKDAFRLLATCKEALRQRGVQDPENYVLLSRNYLAFLLLIGIVPVPPQRKHRFLSLLPGYGMDAEYFPQVEMEKVLPYVNQLMGPQGASYSYYHWGAKTILEGDPKELYGQWAYNVTPVTDSRPYFHHFFSWRGAGKILEQLGGVGFRKMELGYLVVLVTGVCLLVLSFPLLLLALVKGQGKTIPRGARLYGVLYFSCIGMAFMFLELGWIASFQRLVGDPFVTASIVITAVLLSAGIGNLRIRSLSSRLETVTLKGAIRITLFLLLYELLLPYFTFSIAQFPPIVRYGIVFVLVCLPGYSMGLFFPAGLRMVYGHGRSLIPLAWASNGFASVVSSPLSQLLAMDFGFSILFLLAGGAYLFLSVYTFFYAVVKRTLIENRSP